VRHVLRFVIGAAGSLVWLVPTAWAGAAVNDGNQHAGASVVSGTPTAVVVRGPSGELGSYQSRRGGGSRWVCSYFGFELSGPSGSTIGVDYSGGPRQPERGSPYLLACRDETGNVVYSRLVVFDPADPLGGIAAGERAAELALEQIPLPVPEIGLNPPGSQLVGVPTWLWVNNPWGQLSASASIGAVTSTVTAVPTRVSWDVGDGTRVVCDGPGTVYDPSRPAAGQVSGCTHTYTWPSTSEPFGVYAVTATITYATSWEATTGEAGDLGVLERSSSVPVRVVEVQAVIR
jgi:hypothetical protein